MCKHPNINLWHHHITVPLVHLLVGSHHHTGAGRGQFLNLSLEIAANALRANKMDICGIDVKTDNKKQDASEKLRN